MQTSHLHSRCTPSWFRHDQRCFLPGSGFHSPGVQHKQQLNFQFPFFFLSKFSGPLGGGGGGRRGITEPLLVLTLATPPFFTVRRPCPFLGRLLRTPNSTFISKMPTLSDHSQPRICAYITIRALGVLCEMLNIIHNTSTVEFPGLR